MLTSLSSLLLTVPIKRVIIHYMTFSPNLKHTFLFSLVDILVISCIKTCIGTTIDTIDMYACDILSNFLLIQDLLLLFPDSSSHQETHPYVLWSVKSRNQHRQEESVSDWSEWGWKCAVLPCLVPRLVPAPARPQVSHDTWLLFPHQCVVSACIAVLHFILLICIVMCLTNTVPYIVSCEILCGAKYFSHVAVSLVMEGHGSLLCTCVCLVGLQGKVVYSSCI